MFCRSFLEIKIEKNNKRKNTICDICGTEGIKIRRISRAYGQGKDLPIVENIPLISCSHCGESYLSAQTRHKIEEIKLNRSTLAYK